jgi:hypothetical protein
MAPITMRAISRATKNPFATEEKKTDGITRQTRKASSAVIKRAEREVLSNEIFLKKRRNIKTVIGSMARAKRRTSILINIKSKTPVGLSGFFDPEAE